MNREQQRQLTRIGNTLGELRDLLGELRDLLNQLLDLERQRGPQSKMTLQWGHPTVSGVNTGNVLDPQFQSKGESLNMPGKETDTQTVPCSELETDAAGNPVALNPANVKWAIDDATIATLTQNADGSATFKAVKPVAPAVNPRTAHVTCTDSVTGAVGADTLEVDDSPTQPGKMVLTFGTPA